MAVKQSDISVALLFQLFHEHGCGKGATAGEVGKETKNIRAMCNLNILVQCAAFLDFFCNK